MGDTNEPRRKFVTLQGAALVVMACSVASAETPQGSSEALAEKWKKTGFPMGLGTTAFLLAKNRTGDSAMRSTCLGLSLVWGGLLTASLLTTGTSLKNPSPSVTAFLGLAALNAYFAFCD